jgi:hypothetical protein
MNIGHLVTGVLASGVAFLTLVGTQAMTGLEDPAGVVLRGAGVWAVLFGAAAGLPMMFTTQGRRSAVAATLAFGASGGGAGGLVGLLLVTHELGGSPTAVVIDSAIPLVLPWLIGGLLMSVRRYLFDRHRS